MPDVALKRILDYCGFLEIIKLRKVCRDLRNFIEDTKPESYILEFDIILKSNYISLRVYLSENSCQYPNGGMIWIDYAWEKNGCEVTWIRPDNNIKKILGNDDYMDIFFSDLELFLKNRKSIIPYFSLNLKYLDSKLENKFLEKFQNLLKPNSLKVKNFQARVLNSEQFSNYLKLIDPRHLEIIDLKSFKGEDREFKFGELVKSEQWIKTKNLEIWRDFHVDLDIEALCSFEKVKARFESFLTEKFILLKNEFLQNPIPNHFQLYYDNMGSMDLLIGKFGPPTEATDNVGPKKNWIFSIPESDQLISINVYRINHSYGMIIIFRIEKHEIDEKTAAGYGQRLWIVNEWK